MAELEMMVEATERTAELETALLESRGRHLEAMAKIADAEARIALLEKTAGIRDDVLAAMQDELDNLPIFVSAAQKTHSASKNLVMQKSLPHFSNL